jgi:cell division protein FtsQ
VENEKTSNKKGGVGKFLQAIMILVFGLLFVFLIGKTSLNQNEILCNNVFIDIQDESVLQFITKADVIKMANTSEEGNLNNRKISEIDLVKVEKRLEENQFIDNAEVYNNFEGTIKIDIVQKKPLYRVINNDNVSYYISENSYRVPLSSTFTPRRILATGYIPDVENISSDKVNRDLKKIIDFIQSDSFWDAMIGQVKVDKNGDFVLIPKLKGHTVLLGNAEDLDSKFGKLKVFYKKALTKTAWTKYKQINLKYKGQLICSK